MVDDFEISASDGIAEMKAKIKAHGVFVKGTLTETATAGTGATVSLKDTRGLVASDLIKLNDSTNNENTTLTTVATQKTITATLAN